MLRPWSPGSSAGSPPKPAPLCRRPARRCLPSGRGPVCRDLAAALRQARDHPVGLQLFQTFGYYGFAAWVPTLLIAKGIKVTTSLEYAFIIAIANPIGPLLCMLFADRIERKWQVCLGAIGIGIFGMMFARGTMPAALIALGVAVTLCNNLLSYSFHNYQSELFPTRIRSRAIGFVYSWSRLSAALSGLIVAYLLHLGGVDAVFAFIAFAMAVVVVTIGGFGPRTRGLALEAIAH
jgi:MFS transporter, putative metabolite:H+ symporter